MQQFGDLRRGYWFYYCSSLSELKIEFELCAFTWNLRVLSRIKELTFHELYVGFAEGGQYYLSLSHSRQIRFVNFHSLLFFRQIFGAWEYCCTLYCVAFSPLMMTMSWLSTRR